MSRITRSMLSGAPAAAAAAEPQAEPQADLDSSVEIIAEYSPGRRAADAAAAAAANVVDLDSSVEMLEVPPPPPQQGTADNPIELSSDSEMSSRASHTPDSRSLDTSEWSEDQWHARYGVRPPPCPGEIGRAHV